MKNNLRKYELAALFVCLICSLAFVACKKNPGASTDNPSKPPIEEVKVELSDSVSLSNAGGRLRIKCTVCGLWEE